MTLTWTAAAGATSYVLEAGTAAGLTNITTFNTGEPATTLTVPGVPAGTFYVRVRARNADGTLQEMWRDESPSARSEARAAA